MKQHFVVNLFFLIFINILIKPLYIFGIDRVVQNRVGVEDYGTYASLLNISFILSMMLDFGLTNYNNRRIAQDHESINHTFLNILCIKLFFSFLYIIILFFILCLFGFSEWKIKLGISIGFIQILLSLILFLRSNISGLQMFKTDALFSTSDKLFTILIAGFLLFIIQDNFTIQKFVNVQLAGLSLSFLILFIFIYIKISNIKFVLNFNEINRIIKETMPFALLFLLMSVYNRIDIILLERMLNDNGAEAGIYAASFRIIDGLQQFAYLFAAILLPVFAKIIAQKDDINNIFLIGFKLIFLMSTSAVILLFNFRTQIISKMYEGANDYWVNVFAILLFVFIPICVVYLYGSLLTANGNIRELIYISLIGIISMLIVSMFLIQEYKAFGISVSALITQIIIAILHIIVVHKYFKINLSKDILIRSVLFIILSFCSVIYIHQFISSFSFAMIFSIITIICFAFLCKIITIAELVSSSNMLKK